MSTSCSGELTKGDIDMGDQFTVLNVKTPIDDNHITNKKYVDEMDNLKSAFDFKNGSYYAKSDLIMKKNKLGGLREPLQDGEAANKKYVDDKVKNLFIDENDNITFGLNVDMEGNQILGLPEPATDQEPAAKKYVDDLQTQNVDQKGNIKFGRNINLDNKRIFGMKGPTKPKEGANKEYVDQTIKQRIEEEKNNFLPQDPATKNYVDEAIRGIAAGDVLVSKEGVFIKENGHYRATAPLDIDNQKMENVPDPVDDKDAVNKKYIDGVVEALTLKQGLVRENGGFNLVDSYINMNFNRVRNIPYPHHNEDAVPRSFLENMIKGVEEKINKRKQLIAVHARYCGPLKKGEYQFKFGGGNSLENCEEIIRQYEDLKGSIAGFVIPHSGHIKKIIYEYLAFKSFEDIAEFFFNIISKHKKDLQFSDIPFLKKIGYVDIEDFFKKGVDELKKNIYKEENFNKTKTTLDLIKLSPFEFEIVKFEKSFKGEDYYYIGASEELPKIISSVLIDKIEGKRLNFNKKNVGIGMIGRHTNKVYLPLSEGDIINIRTIFNIEEEINNISNNFIQNKFNNFISDSFNYNFTFLIELDPL